MHLTHLECYVPMEKNILCKCVSAFELQTQYIFLRFISNPEKPRIKAWKIDGNLSESKKTNIYN